MFWLSYGVLVIAALGCLGISLYLTISLRPEYVERSQCFNRAALPQYFWLTFLIIFFLWLLVFWSSTNNFLLSIAIFSPSVCLAAVDAQTHFLPNKLLVVVWVAAAVEVLSLWTKSGMKLSILSIVVGLLGGALLWLFAVAGLGLGMGDVKLFPPLLMIAVLSQNLLLYIAVLCFLPGLYAIFVFLYSSSLKQRIAYGPWMVVALPISMLLGT